MLCTAHFVSVLCSFREKRPRLHSAFVFKWRCDFWIKPINSLILSRRKINSTVSFPARPLAAFNWNGGRKKKKKIPSPWDVQSQQRMEMFINQFYLSPAPTGALLQIITPDVLNKLGRRAASGTDCSVSGGRLLGFAASLVKSARRLRCSICGLRSK